MDITSTSRSTNAVLQTKGESAPRGPMRLDAASWFAVGAFAAYIAVGLLA